MTAATTNQETQLRYRIDLPFPVSANRLWRSASAIVHTRRGTILGRPRVHLSALYQSWIKEADGLFLTQRRQIGPVRMLGRYTLACTFSIAKRSPIADGDNLSKCVHDWLQRIEVIRNDCLCEAASWRWGDAPSGCIAMIEGNPWIELERGGR